MEKWRTAARLLKSETLALYLAYRDPRVPWYAKVWAALVLAYAFSPLDFIPDFIPVLGYLDDLLLVPAGIAIAVRMIPEDVMEDAREAAQTWSSERPLVWYTAIVIVLVWLGLALLGVAIFLRTFAGR